MKENKLSMKINWSKTVLFGIWALLLILFILTIARITIIGQAINDILQFLLGWTSYLIIVIFLAIFIMKKLKWQKIKWQKRTKREYLKISWLIINLYWVLGFITAVILIYQQNIAWHNYDAYTLNKIIPTYFQQWSDESIFNYQIKNAEDFFLWHGQFGQTFGGGGLIGLILASLSCYLQLIGGLVLMVMSYFFMVSYFIHNSVFFFFFKKETKDKIKWKNLNERENNQIKTNIIDRIEDQDITIELDTARKIHLQDKESDKNGENNWDKLLKNKDKDAIQKAELQIDDTENKEKDVNVKEPELQTEQKKQINAPEQTQEKATTKQEILPNDDIFADVSPQNDEKIQLNKGEAEINKSKIMQLFHEYQVKAQIADINIGPRVTRYVVALEQGTKVQKILELEPELKMALATQNVRLEAPIPGQSAVGIEIPNKYLCYVNWKSVTKMLIPEENSLKLGIGKNLMGQIEIIHLEDLPHLLVAGTTGGGKSICLLTIISCLIFQKTPKQLKLLLIDPKRVELSIFKDIPHLMSPVIIDNKLVALALEKILNEIEKRYHLLEKQQVNNIFHYNQMVEEHDRLPFIVVVIDELADLILRYRKQVEDKIVRICQIARAVGVFVIVATQRPSADIITSLIKSNIPGRIAFSVSNYNDSRTILNHSGAEKLLGKGDLLFSKPGTRPKRVQGILINKADIEKLTDFWKQQQMTNFYWTEFMNLNEEYEQKNTQHLNQGINLSENDQEIYERIKNFIKITKEVSISLIQRRFNIGFNRAARILEKLENEKFIQKDSKNKTWVLSQ